MSLELPAVPLERALSSDHPFPSLEFRNIPHFYTRFSKAAPSSIGCGKSRGLKLLITFLLGTSGQHLSQVTQNSLFRKTYCMLAHRHIAI